MEIKNAIFVINACHNGSDNLFYRPQTRRNGWAYSVCSCELENDFDNIFLGDSNPQFALRETRFVLGNWKII
jgi:hypothetical protein